MNGQMGELSEEKGSAYVPGGAISVATTNAL